MIVRSGQLDVAIVAGPRVTLWPSVGALELSQFCSKMGLKVGLFGGEAVNVRGVIPQYGTGGLVLIEDVQKRVHRIEARAVVKVMRDTHLPDPFPGWRSQGLIPIETALRLREQGQIYWDPCVVLLGTGNEALRLGSELLESPRGPAEVFCVETHAAWGAKRFAGWEVEKRRFEMCGGRVIEAKPLSLLPLGPLRWELRLQDTQGVRVLEVGRVVSAGPFDEAIGVREYPSGSSLFEFEQSAASERALHVSGWDLEQERGKWLAAKIVKALSLELGEQKGELDSRWKRARARLKKFARHREEPFTPSYQGKWLAPGDLKQVRAFSGVPQREHVSRLVASVECFETISCDLCAAVCPTQAIEFTPALSVNLIESRCTGCGACAKACPSGSIPLIHERGDHQLSTVQLPWRGGHSWKVGATASVVNRRGETLGSARVSALPEVAASPGGQPVGGPPLIQLEVPTHLVWEARGLKRPRVAATEDEAFMESVRRSASSAEKVEVTMDGGRRMVRDKVAVSVALFESGVGRPEDVLYCPDGSCGLCQVTVDGVKKLACQTQVHRGMSIKVSPEAPAETPTFAAMPAATAALAPVHLCPCLGVSVEEVVERVRQGDLRSPEAILSVTRVGEGKCHGQLCMEAFRRAVQAQTSELRAGTENWADWRFPWSDWTLG